MPFTTSMTAAMIFDVAHYLARMTRYLTLHPGDVVWFGRDGPTEPALQPGDTVAVLNDAMGVLRNPVVRESCRRRRSSEERLTPE